MAFSKETIGEAWKRSGGKCECERKGHNHFGLGGRCGEPLTWGKSGSDAKDGWEAHHRVSVGSGGDDTLSNCEILCSWCHKQTGTFGG